MSNVQGRSLAIACAAALSLAVPSLEADVRATTGSRPQSWNTFAADVTIRRGLRDESQQTIGSDGPAVRYRWQRSQADGHWKTTMNVVSGSRPDVETPTGQSQAIPPAIARIEDDGDGSGPRFYSAQGTIVRPPAAGDRQKMGVSDSVFADTDTLLHRPHGVGKGGGRAADEGRDWVEAILPSLERSSERRAALQRRFGKALGKLRGHDRYLGAVADETTEVLADEIWAVPLEVNVLRGGLLESHATFAYEAGPGGALVRRRSHAERVVSGTHGGKRARLAFDIELTNVTLEDRR